MFLCILLASGRSLPFPEDLPILKSTFCCNVVKLRVGWGETRVDNNDYSMTDAKILYIMKEPTVMHILMGTV